jgi:L-threonylcarbamoyladenylate synthase
MDGPDQLQPPSSAELFARAVALLRAGELVAFPTDTVYGVGAVVWDASAVRKLYEAKLRPVDKAIPVLLADPDDLAMVARDLPSGALRLAQHFWPGPLTLVVPRGATIPDEVTAGGNTLAVRIPDHDLARALIRAVGAPLATTSANLSGRSPARTAQEVAAQLVGRIAMILDGGPCPGGVPSTIVDLSSAVPTILRPGPISPEEILAALG